MVKKQAQEEHNYFYLQPKQKEAFKHIGKGAYIFFGGARGGGKTHGARVIMMLCAKQLPGIKIVVVRKTFPELQENFIDVLLNDYPAHIFDYKFKQKNNTMVFSNGSSIVFRPLENTNDLKKVQGLEYQLIILDEANQHKQEWIEKLRGSLRRNIAKLPNFIPTMFMTGNPGGLADAYFKDYYVKPRYNRWRPNDLKYKEKYVFISSKVEDNKFVGQEYIDNLDSQDAQTRAAWLLGDWDAAEGAFFDKFNENYHVVADFPIPTHWTIFAGMDLGHSKEHPTVVLWLTQDPETQIIYVIREYLYGQSGTPERHAKYIQTIHEHIFGDYGDIRVYCDPTMFGDKAGNKTENEAHITSAFVLQQHGISMIPAKNQRKEGWRYLKQLIDYIPDVKEPKIKFFESCTDTISTLPVLKHAQTSQMMKEDLDTTQKYDDIADALRYAVYSATEYDVDSDYEYDKTLIYSMESVQTVNNPIAENSIFKHKEIAPIEKKSVLNPYDAMMMYAYAHNTPIKQDRNGKERTLYYRHQRLRR